jgi:nicotinic acid mononucleotide adenylyltransferase
VRFVWVMGADNFRYFDRWQRCREIAKPVVS